MSNDRQASSGIAQLFRPHIAGEALDDLVTRQQYSRDASPYCQLPAAVLRPRDRDDVVAIVRIAGENGLAIIARAAGTSLAGQCVGAGVILDMSAYFDAVLDVDKDARRAIVQPGVVRDALNRHLAPFNLLFAPDPSTTDRCQIGGMIGNNAWGLHAVSRGTTRDHVTALEVVLADGTIANFGLGRNDDTGKHGELIQNVNEIVRSRAADIEKAYPSVRGITSNAGYALDVLLREQISDGMSGLVPLICGAEGTLAIVTRATLKLIEPAATTRLCCVHFDGIDAALRAVAGIRATQPAALELMDRAILRLAASHPQQSANRFWLRGDPAAVLLVEYAGASSQQVDNCVNELQHIFDRNTMTIVTPEHVEHAWTLRRAALSMLMQAEGGLRAVTGIEDAAVAIADLPDFFAEVSELLRRQSLPFYVYGAVGMGSMHIRPELDLQAPGGLAQYERLLDEVAAITVRHRGSFTCKHGDGRMRGKYLGAVLGEGVLQAMRAVKRSFDPFGILNPGKILDCPPLTADLIQQAR